VSGLRLRLRETPTMAEWVLFACLVAVVIVVAVALAVRLV
jgi:hypothetical protein